MPFFKITNIEPFEILPGVRIRAPYGRNLMLSYLELERGAVVPMHRHPHEQGGIVLKGKVELTVGDVAFIAEEGSMYLVPSNTLHKAVAVDGPAVLLDVFSPIREDYAARFNRYVGSEDAT